MGKGMGFYPADRARHETARVIEHVREILRSYEADPEWVPLEHPHALTIGELRILAWPHLVDLTDVESDGRATPAAPRRRRPAATGA